MISAVRYALRRLLGSPAYTTISLVTLALGIGVNLAMFSIVDTLMFKSSPYPNSEHLLELIQSGSQTQSNVLGRWFSEPEFREIEAQVDQFTAFAAFDRMNATLSVPGQPAERHLSVRFSREGLATLGVAPILGRGFDAAEFQAGNDRVVLLSEGHWRDRFAANPDVIGQTLRLDGEMITIIGVMPASADYPMFWGDVELWRPLIFTPDQRNHRSYRQFWLLGRKRPEVAMETILAQLEPLARQQQAAHPHEYSRQAFHLAPLHEASLDPARRDMAWMLFALSAFVLLIACANLTNLQLARALHASREFAIRAALGASRHQLVAQQLTESLILAVVGGGLALLVAVYVRDLAAGFILVAGERGPSFELDGRLFVAALVLAILAGVVCGVAPALFASRADLNAALKSQARGSTGDGRQKRLRHLLIVGEVALALTMLAGATIMNRGFRQLMERDAGWDTHRVLTGILPIPETRYPTQASRVVFFRKLEERLAAIPGVEHAALSTSLPILAFSTNRQVYVDAPDAPGAATNPLAAHYMITPAYFAAMGISVREGSGFAADVRADGPRQVVVNEALARRFWPNESAVGRRLGGIDDGRPAWFEIVGVVNDVEPAASVANAPTRLAVYRPLVQEAWSYVNIVLRAAPTIPRPESLALPLRQAVTDVDGDLAADFVVTVQQFFERAQSNVILVGQMLVVFAVLGCVLAAVGIYGLMSHAVAQRTPEFGIRLALGGRPRDVLRLVLVHAIKLTGAGLAIGALGAWLLGKYLESTMPRVAHFDVVGFCVVAALLLFVGVVASWLPAHRAMQVDPLSAIRAE